MSFYIKAASKKEVNQHLSMGYRYEVLRFTPGDNEVFDFETLPLGTCVKVFSKYVTGSPYAKAYGTVARNKQGMLYLK